jgi:type I restriction enzyme M protein
MKKNFFDNFKLENEIWSIVHSSELRFGLRGNKILFILRYLLIKFNSVFSDQITKTSELNTSYSQKISEVLLAIPDQEKTRDDELLSSLIDKFLQPQSFKPDLLGKTCDNLIEMFVENEGKNSSTYTTPKKIVKLLICIIDPNENMRICDPVCGVGEFLAECHRTIKQKGKNEEKLLLYGQEKDAEILEIAQINLLLHGIYNFEIRSGNCLENPEFINDKFDRVITNPPFNLDKWGYKNLPLNDKKLLEDKDFKFRYSSKTRGNFAFIEHVLALLNDKGIGCILQPFSVLSSRREKEIRKKIVESDLIEAIIGLPPNLFYTTNIPVIILVFNKNKTDDRKEKILFINLNNRKIIRESKKQLSDQDIEKVVKTFKEFINEDEYSQVIDTEAINKKDFDFNFNFYIKTVTNNDSIKEKEITRNLVFEKLINLEIEREELEQKFKEHLRQLRKD